MVRKAGGDTRYQRTWTVGFASEPGCAGAQGSQSRCSGLTPTLLQEAAGPRSPTVFGAIISYIEQFFETVGISLANRQVYPSFSSALFSNCLHIARWPLSLWESVH